MFSAPPSFSLSFLPSLPLSILSLLSLPLSLAPYCINSRFASNI